MLVFAPLLAAVLPFFVWPLELFLPYPAVIEELAKAVIIYLSSRNEPLFIPLHTGIVVGTLFALSESVLYLFNIASVGTISTFLLRLAVTIPLHAGTSVIISKNIFKNKTRVLIGMSAAIAVHYAFNLIVRTYSGVSAF